MREKQINLVTKMENYYKKKWNGDGENKNEIYQKKKSKPTIRSGK